MEMKEIMELYLKEISSYPLLSADEEKELARVKIRSDKKGEEAKEKLIYCNLRLVIKIAKKFLGRGVDFDDLIQAGNEGLMKVVTKYDGREGNRFATYAGWWILVHIQKALVENEAVKIPFYFNAQTSKVRKAERRLTGKNGLASVSEIAENTGMSEKDVMTTQQVTRAKESVSLHKKINNGEQELIDLLSDHYEKALKAETRSDLRKKIINDLSQLPSREAKIIYWRGDYDPKNPERNKSYFKTYQEIGSELGITYEWVRQLHQRALKKLRTWEKFKILRELYNAY